MSAQGHDVQAIVIASVAAAGPLPVAGARFQLGPKAGAVLVVQASAIVTSFQLEGRISPEAPWAIIAGPNATFVAGGGQTAVTVASAMTEMRLQWNGNAGTINAWLQA